MVVACPTCRAQYRLDAQRLKGGRGRLRCARCRTVFPVEAGTDGGEQRAAAGETGTPAVAAPRARLEIAVLAFEPGAAQKRFQAVMQAAGLRVALADDGPNALDVARRSRPRLVASSFRLPDLSGPELLAAVRDEPALSPSRTLLIGGPVPRLHSPATLAAIHGADAHLPRDARETEIDAVVRALLGLPGGELAPPAEESLRAHARVSIADLKLYFERELDAGRRDGRLHPRVAEYLARARVGCLDRFPELRTTPAPLTFWDDEVRKMLRKAAPA